MKIKNLLIILILALSLVIGLQFVAAENNVNLENSTTINISGNNLILPGNYTYINGNNTDIVVVEDTTGKIFAITSQNPGQYYGITTGFQQVDTGDFNVTGIYCEDANINSACILNDNGTCLIVDKLNTNNSQSNTNCSYQLGSDLQIANNLIKADFNLLNNNKNTASDASQTNIHSNYSKSSIQSDYNNPTEHNCTSSKSNDTGVPELAWDL